MFGVEKHSTSSLNKVRAASVTTAEFGSLVGIRKLVVPVRAAFSGTHSGEGRITDNCRNWFTGRNTDCVPLF